MKSIDRFIKNIIFKRMKSIKSEYNRILPLGDYFLNRWEKAEFADFGENSSVYDSCLILGKVSVGKNCWIGPFTILDGSGGELKIGDNCNISAGVQIYTHDTVDRVIKDEIIKTAPVSIGHNCYIGPNAVIAKGVTIGNFVVIGANSFVNKNVEDFSKLICSSTKVVSKINKENFL